MLNRAFIDCNWQSLRAQRFFAPRSSNRQNVCARSFYPFLKSIAVIKRTKSLGCESYNLRLAQTPCCRQFKNKIKNSSGSNFKNYGVARYRSKRKWFGQGIDLTWFFDFVLVLSLPHSQGLFQDNYAWRRELSSDDSQAKMKLRRNAGCVTLLSRCLAVIIPPISEELLISVQREKRSVFSRRDFHFQVVTSVEKLPEKRRKTGIKTRKN